MFLWPCSRTRPYSVAIKLGTEDLGSILGNGRCFCFNTHSDRLYVLLSLLFKEYWRIFQSTKEVKHLWELPSLSHIGSLQRMLLTDKDILSRVLACSICYYFMYFIESILNTSGRKYLKVSYILFLNRARARARAHTHTHTHIYMYK